jgi:2'-5' RNA ligase
MTKRSLETSITLILEHVDAELAQAHRELYPERIYEQIPLCLTLLYPWIPPELVTVADVERLRGFFASRPPLMFDLTRVAEFPNEAVYAVPEPDDELRAMMRTLWAMYPDYPPYGEPGSDPPPHCTLGRLEGDYPISLDQAVARVEHILPVSCVVEEASLEETYEVDRWRVRENFLFGGVTIV